MTILRPFKCVRPSIELASSIAALPYDVYNREEARLEVEKHPLSFLKIDRPETQFSPSIDMYSQPVYDKARETLKHMIADGSFIREDTPVYYLYALTMNGRTQTGLVGCASIDDYLENRIKKHENTRPDKEVDRTRHVDTLSAQTGPIFLAYHMQPTLKMIFDEVKNNLPLYDFTSEDAIRHQVWSINDTEYIKKISHTFHNINSVYIADGHHRAASAVKAGLMRRNSHPEYDGTEEFNYFLSVLFPAEELHILDYNRVVFDLNGQVIDEFLEKLKNDFSVTSMAKKICQPSKKGEIGLYAKGSWYLLEAKSHLFTDDPVADLDASILQNVVLSPLLGIQDPKTDSRIQFVGGIRGLPSLAQTVDAMEDGIAFAMYPTSMDELLAVADAGLLMPPKSTWFEPKLRSGLFIHEFEC